MDHTQAMYHTEGVATASETTHTHLNDARTFVGQRLGRLQLGFQLISRRTESRQLLAVAVFCFLHVHNKGALVNVLWPCGG